MTAYTAEQIVETIARAICRQELEVAGAEFLMSGEATGQEAAMAVLAGTAKHWPRYSDHARAALAKALELLREPTNGQVNAGEFKMTAREIWYVMIDARIKELG